MQLFIDNWSTELAAPAAADAVQLSVPPAVAAKLIGLGAGDHYQLTLVKVTEGAEIAWENVRVTSAVDGILAVERGLDGTTALSWVAGDLIEARLTASGLQALRRGAPIRVIAATTYTLLQADAGSYLCFIADDDIAVNVPQQDIVSWMDGTEFHLVQIGDGKVQVSSSGINLWKQSGLLSRTPGKGAVASLKRWAPDIWGMFGDLEQGAPVVMPN